MNYTEKYHLPQWEETDRIMRVDFNQMCADMESGLNSNAQAAETANETARDAKAEALKLPYVVGSYTGDGAETREFNLGFPPRFLIICSTLQETGSTGAGNKGVLMTGPTHLLSKITLTDTGFQLKKSTFNPYPDPNMSNVAYDYIAFR